MQIIRTAAWIAITAILVGFIAMNWTKAPVNFWPLEDGNYFHFEWPVGFIALVFFLLGVVPAWLYLRAVRWRLTRRIATLENSLRASSLPSINVRSEDAASIGTSTPGALSPTPSPES